MLDVVDDFLWTLRRGGFVISTAGAIDAARAVAEIGFTDRDATREAIACVVVDRADRRARFDEAFDRFFSSELPRPATLADRLLAEGLTPQEIAALEELLLHSTTAGDDGGSIGALLRGGASLDHLLASAGAQRVLERLNGPLQRGFSAHRLLEAIGLPQAREAALRFAERLSLRIGAERAAVLTEALVRELARAEELAREQIDRRLAELARTEGGGLAAIPFAELSEEELGQVRRGVRALAERLRGAARVRDRRRRRGRIDPGRTLRRSLATFGVPLSPVRVERRRDRPRLVVLCDVSDSVRRAARFMLELVYAVSELFEGVRSFVFVSELGEVTRLFASEPAASAITKAACSAVNVRDSSSYGRALRAFEKSFASAVDRRTTVLILGDGRTNYGPTGADVVRRLRERAKALVWLCPEPRASWGTGDSAMPAYAAAATSVLEAACARDLERAARLIVARG